MCNAFVRHDLSRREGRGEKHYRIARADKSRPQPRTRLAWESKISRLLGIYALVRGNENVFASSFFDKEGEEKKRKEEEEKEKRKEIIYNVGRFTIETLKISV